MRARSSTRTGGAQEFRLWIEDTGDALDQDVADYVSTVALDGHNRILRRIPVDKGETRGSLQMTLGSEPAADVNRRPEASASEARSRSAQVKPYQDVYIGSVKPQMDVLENGGYPNPPTLGTWLKKGQAKGTHVGPGYFKFSEGGYSRQAPRGMFAITLEELVSDYGGR